MGLFGRSSDDGCTAHHWGEYTPDYHHISRSVSTTLIRTESGVPHLHAIKASFPITAVCQHEGCAATDRRGEKEFVLPWYLANGSGDDVSLAIGAFGRSDPKVDADLLADRLREMADAIDPEVDNDE